MKRHKGMMERWMKGYIILILIVIENKPWMDRYQEWNYL